MEMAKNVEFPDGMQVEPATPDVAKTLESTAADDAAPESGAAAPVVKEQPETVAPAVKEQSEAVAPAVATAKPEGVESSAALAVVNSMSHPAAWAWLHRNCRPDKQIVPKEVLDDWLAGGSRRNKLLQSFVKRIYQPNQSQQATAMRLEAWNKIRQVTRDFTKSFQGFAWKTEEELQKMEWSETLGVCGFIISLLFTKYKLI